MVELILTVVSWIIRDFLLRIGILENVLTPWNFKAGRSTSELRFVYEQPILRSPLWIKEVEIAKSIGELVTSRSITGQHNFLDFAMLDAMIASAVKKLLNTQSHFRSGASVEEQRAQKDDRFSRGRKIAYMIYENFRATGAEEAVQGLSDLFKRSFTV